MRFMSKTTRNSTPEYVAWANMIQRCYNPKRPEFKNYGGRGILVCDRWRSYDLFFEDMGCRPSDRHTLERRDNARGYEPGNCYWATRGEQLRNKRNNVLFTINGVTRCFEDWCAHYGINPTTCRHRMERSGMTLEAALTTPVQTGWKQSPLRPLMRQGSFNRWAK